MEKIGGLFQITQKYIQKSNGNKLDIKCDWKLTCKFVKSKQHCHGPLVGSEKSKILIVAESPSGKGITFAKMFEDVERKGKNKNLLELRDLIKTIDNNNTPHFTDVVKCGVTGAIKKYDLLNKRYNNCKKYLLEEIMIIEPELIISVGWYAREKIKELIKENNIKIKHCEILHFSDNGKMNITIVDKKDIIWPLQLITFFSNVQPKSTSILDLNYFKLFKSRLLND